MFVKYWGIFFLRKCLFLFILTISDKQSKWPHLVSDQCQVSQQPHPSIHTWHLNITNTLCFQVFQDTETILKPLDYNYTHFNSHLAPQPNKHIVSKILETILNSILSQLCPNMPPQSTWQQNCAPKYLKFLKLWQISTFPLLQWFSYHYVKARNTTLDNQVIKHPLLFLDQKPLYRHQSWWRWGNKVSRQSWHNVCTNYNKIWFVQNSTNISLGDV